MSIIKRIVYANAMLFANVSLTVMGIVLITWLSPPVGDLGESSFTTKVLSFLADYIGWFMILILAYFTYRYERPIRHVLRSIQKGEASSDEAMVLARRRLLNEPYFVFGLVMAVWTAVGLIVTAIWLPELGSRYWDSPRGLRPILTGLFIGVMVFFLLEIISQRLLAPVFFENGRLWSTKGAWRIRIIVRLAGLVVVAGILPVIAIYMNIVGYAANSTLSPQDSLIALTHVIGKQASVFIILSIGLAFLVGINITQPIKRMIAVLRDVSQGRFENRVQVSTNDEIGYAGDVINDMTDGLKDREKIRDTFGKYVSQAVRDEVLAGKIPLDGEEKDVTVMFADLRNFTPLTESHDPKTVVRIMNIYFDEMAKAIKGHGGLILQFLGDEIYAVFGAPVATINHAQQAVTTAVEMMRLLVNVNVSLAQKGYPQLAHGIGIHSGPVVAANIGSSERMSYLLVGDTVNTASRLQGVNKEYDTEVIVSANTYDRLVDKDQTGLKWQKLPPTKVKGKDEPIDIYTISIPFGSNNAVDKNWLGTDS